MSFDVFFDDEKFYFSSNIRGGYIAGSASSFDGNDLIRESGEGVVVVIIQYRLGVFGFLPGQKVKDGGALNAGLRTSQFLFNYKNLVLRIFFESQWINNLLCNGCSNMYGFLDRH